MQGMAQNGHLTPPHPLLLLVEFFHPNIFAVCFDTKLPDNICLSLFYNYKYIFIVLSVIFKL